MSSPELPKSHRLSIGRPMRGDGVEEIAIEIKNDDKPRDRVVVTIDLEAFAKVITGLSEQPCAVAIRGAGIEAPE